MKMSAGPLHIVCTHTHTGLKVEDLSID